MSHSVIILFTFSFYLYVALTQETVSSTTAETLSVLLMCLARVHGILLGTWHIGAQYVFLIRVFKDGEAEAPIL